ncbi:unnamed protein product, partial [Prorocentrum cordatum]
MRRHPSSGEVSFLKGIPGHPNLIAHRDSFMEEGSTGISSGVRVGGVDIKTGEGGGGPYLFLLMSYAEDGDLRLAMKDRKQAQQTVPELVVLSWLRQTIAGLRHMHAHGVIHRDLKSSNIFLSGGRRVARIGDFGISKVLESVSFAQTGVGTPAYMAPETMTEMRYDFQADIWALGCILFELCALDAWICKSALHPVSRSSWFARLFVCLFVCAVVCLCVFACLCVCLSVCLSVGLSV